jgi:putative FmdB family regulatory protein
MPVYEYQCETCQLRFEKLQRFSDSPLTECPNCGGPVHRVMQPVGVIFKGSGFYVTDNRGKSSTMPPTKREGESKSEGKSDGKSAEGESSGPKVDSAPKAAEGQSGRAGEQ